MRIIEAKHNLISHHMQMHLTLKYTPKLQFYYDDSLEYVERINEVIQKIHSDD